MQREKTTGVLTNRAQSPGIGAVIHSWQAPFGKFLPPHTHTSRGSFYSCAVCDIKQSANFVTFLHLSGGVPEMGELVKPLLISLFFVFCFCSQSFCSLYMSFLFLLTSLFYQLRLCHSRHGYPPKEMNMYTFLPKVSCYKYYSLQVYMFLSNDIKKPGRSVRGLEQAYFLK